MEGAVTLLSGGTHTSSVCTSWTTATRRDHRASSRVRSRPAAIAVADPSAHEEMTQIKEAIPSQKGIIRRVDYFYVTAPNKPGEGVRMLSTLQEGV